MYMRYAEPSERCLASGIEVSLSLPALRVSVGLRHSEQPRMWKEYLDDTVYRHAGSAPAELG